MTEAGVVSWRSGCFKDEDKAKFAANTGKNALQESLTIV
jgi:hypothetical protein